MNRRLGQHWPMASLVIAQISSISGWFFSLPSAFHNECSMFQASLIPEVSYIFTFFLTASCIPLSGNACRNPDPITHCLVTQTFSCHLNGSHQVPATLAFSMPVKPEAWIMPRSATRFSRTWCPLDNGCLWVPGWLNLTNTSPDSLQWAGQPQCSLLKIVFKWVKNVVSLNLWLVGSD
jgi:hypothetical protein